MHLAPSSVGRGQRVLTNCARGLEARRHGEEILAALPKAAGATHEFAPDIDDAALDALLDVATRIRGRWTSWDYAGGSAVADFAALAAASKGSLRLAPKAHDQLVAFLASHEVHLFRTGSSTADPRQAVYSAGLARDERTETGFPHAVAAFRSERHAQRQREAEAALRAAAIEHSQPVVEQARSLAASVDEVLAQVRLADGASRLHAHRSGIDTWLANADRQLVAAGDAVSGGHWARWSRVGEHDATTFRTSVSDAVASLRIVREWAHAAAHDSREAHAPSAAAVFDRVGAELGHVTGGGDDAFAGTTVGELVAEAAAGSRRVKAGKRADEPLERARAVIKAERDRLAALELVVDEQPRPAVTSHVDRIRGELAKRPHPER